jgi:hypothetical protein
MRHLTKILIEGLDRLGKDTLASAIQHRHGYYQVLHYTRPRRLDCYAAKDGAPAERQYQEASFRTMFQLLRDARESPLICNRAHLGECVYAPMYRGYDGGYVFELEREFRADKLPARLLLLTENFDVSRHFVDDGQGLGTSDKRRTEQARFIEALNRSSIPDKRVVCVTDIATGMLRSSESILNEALA